MSTKSVLHSSRISVRERMRLAREEALLDTAYELFGEKGFGAMTMDDLAACAAVSKATLYKHFPSKDDLAKRVVLRTISRTIEFIRSIDAAKPEIERLEICLRTTLRNRLALARAAGDSLIALQTTVLGSPEYRERHETLIGLITAMVDGAKAQGAIDPGLSSRVLAQVPVSLIRDAEYPRLVESGACSADDLVDTLVAVALRGMRPRLEVLDGT